LLCGLPIEVNDKIKVAAAPHRKAMREYMIELLAAHVKELKRKGITLALPNGK
jgi:porphobilinogen deaminase